jgi:hypothetical protein
MVQSHRSLEGTVTKAHRGNSDNSLDEKRTLAQGQTKCIPSAHTKLSIQSKPGSSACQLGRGKRERGERGREPYDWMRVLMTSSGHVIKDDGTPANKPTTRSSRGPSLPEDTKVCRGQDTHVGRQRP